MSTVRTRFAPSPTGYMHIGGMRTALFNWLWARHNGGQFILRIDDTDQERNVAEALEPIFRAFRWLGLDWDEGPDVGGPHGPYYQSQCGDLYQAAIDRLLAAGHAYRDFEPPAETQKQREAAEKEKRTYVSSRQSLELSDSQRADLIAQGTPHVVRLLVPRDRRVAIDDVVRGHVEWDCALMPDPVLCRSNGTFLYNFATVVDDARLQISHVIRAEEHLTNTAVQALLHEALGNPLPVFAHIPFITAPGSTKKLSKRDLQKLRSSPQLKKLFDRADEVFPRLGLGDSTALSPVMVEYYERLGYLPAGVLNALGRLGWSLDDKTEYFSRAELVAGFTLDRIVKKPAGFDADKLASYQAHWMSQLSLEEKLAGSRPFVDAMVEREGWGIPSEETLPKLIAAVGDRLKVFSDILDYPEFFVKPEGPSFEHTICQQVIPPIAIHVLEAALRDLSTLSPHSRDELRRALKWIGDDSIRPTNNPQPHNDQLKTLPHQLFTVPHPNSPEDSINAGKKAALIRLALTGRTAALGIVETISVLGVEESSSRLKAALKIIKDRSSDADYPAETREHFEQIIQRFPETVLYDSSSQIVRNFDQSGGGPTVLRQYRAAMQSGGKEDMGTLEILCLPNSPGEGAVFFKCHSFFRLVHDRCTLAVFEDESDRPSRQFDCWVGWSSSRADEHGSSLQLLARPDEPMWSRGGLCGSVDFFLGGFHDYRGHSVRTGESSWGTVRLVFTAHRFKLTLDRIWKCAPSQIPLWKRAVYKTVHAGRIEWLAGDQDVSEWTEIGDMVFSFFSFLRGRMTGPFFSEAFSDGKLVMQQLIPMANDAPIDVRSWFPLNHGSDVEPLLALFEEKWTSSNREMLRRAVWHYACANRTVDPLEYGVHGAKLCMAAVCDMIGKSMNGDTSENHVQWIAEYVGVDRIPVPEIGSGNSSPSELAAIVEQIHRLDETNELYGDVLYGLHQGVLYLCELAILKWLGYQGRYHDRLLSKWSSDSSLVPWADAN